MTMDLREAAIAKIQHLPEPLLEEVSDFIDFVTMKHTLAAVPTPGTNLAARWSAWLHDLGTLEIQPSPPTTEYQHHLVEKYRQQGLDL